MLSKMCRVLIQILCQLDFNNCLASRQRPGYFHSWQSGTDHHSRKQRGLCFSISKQAANGSQDLQRVLTVYSQLHGALLAIASMAIAYTAVVFGSRALPYWQNAVFAVHILGFFAYLVPIWVNAPTATHHQVWFEFENFGGWSSLSLAALVGQLTGISGFAGLDAVSVHLLLLVRTNCDGL